MPTTRCEADSPFLAGWWWETMRSAGLPPGATASFPTHDGTTLPLLISRDGRPQGLTGPYTCLYQPLFPADAGPAHWRQAGTDFGRDLRPAGTTRLDALDADAPWLAAFLAGARAAGLRAARFEHFGNWHEPLGTRSWPDYLAARPGKLRETIRRKTRKTADFSLVTGGPDLEAGIAAYDSVYARSWKIPEPFPAFNAELMRHAAAAGTLRLGLLHVDRTPIAAQLWITTAGTAYVLKLAHDEAHKTLSPGTVLTAHMIRHLIESERVTELDFGRGDDPYKQLWATHRRQRIGVILANPWHPAGAAALARHAIGRLRRRLR